MNDQSGHYMAVPGQDSQQAKQNADSLIMSNISQASQGTDASGHMSSNALDHLGDAMHTLEDMTSPMTRGTSLRRIPALKLRSCRP